MGMRGLDDYIMGVNLSHDEDVPHRCPKCGRNQNIPMFFDMGGWFYKDDEAWCDLCSAEMEVIDVQAQAS